MNKYKEIEDLIIKYLKTKNYSATWVIANTIGMRGKTKIILKIMKNLKLKNIVELNEIESSSNNYVWKLV